MLDEFREIRFHKWKFPWGYPKTPIKWIVYHGTSDKQIDVFEWMIWGYPHFRKPAGTWHDRDLESESKVMIQRVALKGKSTESPNRGVLYKMPLPTIFNSEMLGQGKSHSCNKIWLNVELLLFPTWQLGRTSQGIPKFPSKGLVLLER